MEYFMTEPVITFEAAGLVLATAAEYAQSLGVPVCIAVPDRVGHLVAFARLDDALIGAIGVSGGSAQQDQAVAEAGARDQEIRSR